MTRLQIREEILEVWLAETNSDFYDDTPLNRGIDHEYRLFCAETGAGPFAEFLYTDATGTKRSWDLPAELVDIWRVDYATTKDEVPFLPFQHFALRFGTDWIANTGTGQPDAYAIVGNTAILFEPIPANTITWRLYGPIVPDAPGTDSTTLLVPDADAYTIAKRAYVWAVERNLSRLGTAPPNYERIKADALRETELAKGRIRRLYGSIRAAGSVPSAGTQIDVLRKYGPLVAW